jgi:hypothetical protein
VELGRPGLRAVSAPGISRLRGFLEENPGSRASRGEIFLKSHARKSEGDDVGTSQD